MGDTKSALAWSATYKDLMECFEARRKEIANEDNDTLMNATRWGDEPYRWDRL